MRKSPLMPKASGKIRATIREQFRERGRGRFRGRGRGRFRGGSVLILVVVMLALLTLLGAAYLQIARVDREASKSTTGNIDAVVNAIVGQVQTTLHNAVINPATGVFFDQSSASETAYLAPYDYPWTNTNTGHFTADSRAVGGHYDDTWLASTTPDFYTDPANPRWSHLTNLTGVYLTNVGSATDPTPDYIDNNAHQSDTNIIIDTTNGSNQVDADGDGVPDSRWTWAPIKQIGGVQYVMAVRIIDNSSLINLNTATALTTTGQPDTSGFYLGTNNANNPRGYFPTDVDLSRLMDRANGASSSYVGETLALLNTRSLHWTTTTNIGPYPTGLLPAGLANFPASSSYTNANPGTRTAYWLDTARKYGMPTTLNYDDETDLRYRGGLNRKTVVSNVEKAFIGAGSASLLLRQQPPLTDEKTYTDVTGTPVNATTMANWFQGGTGADVKSRSFYDVRKFLTTRSGAAVLAYDYSQMGFPNQSRRLKYDLTYEDGGAATATPVTRATNIAKLLATIFKTGIAGTNPTYSGTTYLGLDNTTLEEMACQFAANIQDYSAVAGPTTPLTVQSAISGSTSTKTCYGLEALPFFREAYVEAAYAGEDKWDGTGGAYSANVGPPPPGDNHSDTWTYLPNSDAFAIELGNPFDRQIKLDNVRVQIGPQSGPTPATSTAATYTFPVGTTIDVRQQTVFYVNPGATPSPNETGCTGKLPKDLSFTGTALTPDGTSLALTGANGVATGTQLIVKLQVKDSGGNWVTYDRFTLGAFKLPPGPFDASMTTPPLTQGSAKKTPIHMQISLVRDDTGIHYISNLGRIIVNSPGRTTVQNIGTYGTTYDKLGQTGKGATGDTTLNNTQIPLANRPIFSVAELGWIWMLGFNRDTTTYSNDNYDPGDMPTQLEALNLGTLPKGVARRFLDISAAAKVPTVPANVPAVPHAAMIMDQFTTISPAYDGINNTTGLAPDPTIPASPPWPANNEQRIEQFVPGLININTMPLHLLSLVAPLPEGIDNIQSLMAAITTYRDTPAQRTALMPSITSRSAPGIASIGELLFINPTSGTTIANGLPSGTTSTTDCQMQKYGVANGVNATGVLPSPVLYPMPEEMPSPVVTSYSTTGDPTQLMARFQYLSQIFTTRSDIFTAYVIVRGYKVGHYNDGPVETARFLAVFDRSGLTQNTDPVKVVAFYRLN